MTCNFVQHLVKNLHGFVAAVGSGCSLKCLALIFLNFFFHLINRGEGWIGFILSREVTLLANAASMPVNP